MNLPQFLQDYKNYKIKINYRLFFFEISYTYFNYK